MQKISNSTVDYVEKTTTILLLISLIAYNLVNLFVSCPISVDEIEHIHASWLVWDGQIPYRDFFEHHNPLLWYIFAPLTGIMYDNANIIYVCRFITFCVSLAGWYYIYKIVMHCFNNFRVWILTFVIFQSLSVFSINIVDFRPDIYMNFLIIFGIWYYMQYLTNPKAKYLSISFSAFLLSILILQKSALLVLLIGFYTLYLLYKKKIQFKHLLIASIAPALILLSFIFWLWYNELFLLYWQLNVEFNYLLSLYYGFTIKTFYLFSNLIQLNSNSGPGAITVFPEIWFLIVLCIIAYPTHLQYKKDSNRFLFFVTISEIALRFLTFSPLRHYYAFFIILAGIIVSVFLLRNLTKIKRTIYISTLFVVTLMCGGSTISNSGSTSVSGFIHIYEYIIDNTEKDETVLNGALSNYNLFRPNADYQWFLLEDLGYIYNTHYDTGFNLNKLIAEKKPTIIFTKEYNNQVFKTHRYSSVTQCNYQTLLLSKIEPQIRDILPKILIQIPNTKAYDIDKDMVNKYYRPTEITDMMILKDEYRHKKINNREQTKIGNKADNEKNE